MENEWQLLGTIAPEMIDIVEERFRILRNIQWMAPVGRRTLATKIGVTERVLRTETDTLKQLQLIETSKSGMTLTSKGEQVLKGLEQTMGQLLGMKHKEIQLANCFGIEKCVIIPGDSDEEPNIQKNFGTVVSDALFTILPNKTNIIAVMGGTTMATVAENMSNIENTKAPLTFVPARGGIGEAANIQANSVSSMMAEKTGGISRPLYVPEQVSPETYKPLLQEPSVQEVLELIKQSECVIHGIGQALHMAARRGMSEEQMTMLQQNNAVAESFGYFFDENGEVVFKIPRIGLQLKDLQHIACILAVAGGKSKAKAIHSYMKNAPQQTWLITDEGAANEILKGFTL